jgi:hypothetical protein
MFQALGSNHRSRGMACLSLPMASLEDSRTLLFFLKKIVREISWTTESRAYYYLETNFIVQASMPV